MGGRGDLLTHVIYVKGGDPAIQVKYVGEGDPLNQGNGT